MGLDDKRSSRKTAPFCLDGKIVRWLDTVEDAETLRYISRYARRLAEAIESPVDDDFRSRA